MIKLLPLIYLHENRPAFYDTDSVTVIELSANLTGKMNEIIEDYNKFATDVNTRIEQHILNADSDREVFETALRQEFQDFIDIVNLKISIIQGELNTIKDVVFDYDSNEEGLIIGG